MVIDVIDSSTENEHCSKHKHLPINSFKESYGTVEGLVENEAKFSGSLVNAPFAVASENDFIFTHRFSFRYLAFWV
jgi:hypothetical protein